MVKRMMTKLCCAAVLTTAWSVTAVAAPQLADCNDAVSVFNPAYDDCFGATPGNDIGAQGTAQGFLNDGVNNDGNGVFGADNWTFLASVDDSKSSVYFSVFDTSGVNSGIGQTDGSISFNVNAIENDYGTSFLQDFDLVISFKAGNGYSLYEWDAPIWGALGQGAPDIAWSTVGVYTNNGTPQDLSHASVWLRQTDFPTGADVSEPAIFSLLGLGFLGLAIAKRKQ